MYRVVLLLSGGRRVAILGSGADRGQDDWSALQDYLLIANGTSQPRGLWVMGSGFGESEGTGDFSLLNLYLRVAAAGTIPRSPAIQAQASR
jgi:hypothetical protein